jgi:hypothetical protein
MRSPQAVLTVAARISVGNVEASTPVAAAARPHATQPRSTLWVPMYHLQIGGGGSVSDVAYPQFGDAPDSLPHDRKYDLRTVLELLKSAASQLSQDDQLSDGVADLSEACEEDTRNYDRALSLVLVQLLSHARQDLAMERL